MPLVCNALRSLFRAFAALTIRTTERTRLLSCGPFDESIFLADELDLHRDYSLVLRSLVPILICRELLGR